MGITTQRIETKQKGKLGFSD
jgi:hypothetical protein